MSTSINSFGIVCCVSGTDAETEIPLDSPGHERKAVGSTISSGKSETGGASLTEKTSSVAPENVASGFAVSSRQAETRKVQVLIDVSTAPACSL
jgi:hypothetical protein